MAHESISLPMGRRPIVVRRSVWAVAAALVIAVAVVGYVTRGAGDDIARDTTVSVTESAQHGDRALRADAARWTGLAGAYGAGTGLTPAQAADAARWTGLAEISGAGIGLTREQVADAARWTGLAGHHLGDG